MEKNKIGLNAGKVWRILNEKGELSMFDWLARESKVLLRKKEGMLFASIENVEFSFG